MEKKFDKKQEKNEERNQQNKDNLEEIKANDELAEMKETLQRLQAEFENYQKRTQRESVHFQTIANASLMSDLLPVLDTLEHGIIHNKDFVAIKEQLEKILQKKGLQKIVVEKGNDFDHDKMECMLNEHCDDVSEGKVATVLVNGYTLNGRVLRPTKVSIAMAPSHSNNKNNNPNEINENKTKETNEIKNSEDEENKKKENK
jgi:molecular chaperone GrpE